VTANSARKHLSDDLKKQKNHDKPKTSTASAKAAPQRQRKPSGGNDNTILLFLRTSVRDLTPPIFIEVDRHADEETIY
jgi:hypothetical protein